MAVVCKVCGRQYDITLLEFGRSIRCDCGNIIDLKTKVFVDKMISKEAQEAIISILEKAEDFYVPVKKIWKELRSQGYELGEFDDFLRALKKDKKFEISEFKDQDLKDGKEMEELGFYSGPRVKLKSRKITKEDMERIILKHMQNMIDNLVKAYQVSPEDLSPEEEDKLIEIMRKAKDLKEKIKATFKPKKEDSS
jgi:hypothetical protein